MSIVKITNVRLSFADLFQPDAKYGRYGASFPIVPGSANAAALDAAVTEVAAAKWGAKAEAVLAKLKGDGVVAYAHSPKVNADGEVYDGYSNMYTLNASNKASCSAVRDAWPLLEQAKEVHLLTVTPHGDGGPDGYLQRHFERHGLKANLIVDRRADLDASAILRGCVSSLQIDLVVMGLYGRPRLQELVLGGVSHDLLAHPPTPLLVSH